MKDSLRTLLITLLVCLVLLAGTSSVLLLSGENSSRDEVVITYWTHEDEARRSLEESLISSFEKDNPGIRVERVEYSSTEQLRMVMRGLKAGRGPVMFNFPEEQISDLLPSFLSPVDPEAFGLSGIEEILERYQEGAFSVVTTRQGIYGIPMELTSWCLYVNKNLLREVGLDPDTDYPKTWEEMVSICQLLTRRDGQILLERGFDFRYPYYLSFLVPMVEQNGGSLFSPDGKEVIYNEEAWIKVLSFMAEWSPNGLNLGSPTYRNARSLFNEEKIAMCLSGLYQESRLEKGNPDFYSSGEWMVVPFPRFASSVQDTGTKLYSHYYLVNSAASEKEQKAAWRLIAHFADHALDYLKTARLIVPTREVIAYLETENIPYSDIFLSEMKKSSRIYSGAKAVELQSLIGEAVESVMLRSVEPEKAVFALKSAATELFM